MLFKMIFSETRHKTSHNSAYVLRRPCGRLGLRGATARRSATWASALVGPQPTSHTGGTLNDSAHMNISEADWDFFFWFALRFCVLRYLFLLQSEHLRPALLHSQLLLRSAKTYTICLSQRDPIAGRRISFVFECKLISRTRP